MSLLSGQRRPIRLLLSILLLSAAVPVQQAPAQEVIELKTIAIIGNRELPKTLIIVPWKTPQPNPIPEPVLDSVLDQPAQAYDAIGLQRRIDLYRAGFVLD